VARAVQEFLPWYASVHRGAGIRSQLTSARYEEAREIMVRFVGGDPRTHQALFPRVASVVHHGGAGTTMTAAVAGAPQVIVPQLVDQPNWARRVAELGIGAAHDGPVPTAASLAGALGTALAPDTRQRARVVAGDVRTDGAMVAARRLLAS